jgi:flotillin
LNCIVLNLKKKVLTDVIYSSLMYGVPSLILVLVFFYVLSLRRIVPTNVVHIVQRGNQTVSYGTKKSSNVYYEWPGWLPKLGVTVRVLPVSNFDVDLRRYEAYDKDRVPFVVDVKAFFHIADTNVAAEKVESFEELRAQLENVVQGAVRSILAKSKLEEIMEERSVFGKQFTEAVNTDLKNWGVEAIKSIELMDVRDADNSQVIHEIMAKRMSAISMESRTEVAKNTKLAEQAELIARQEIDVTKAETERIAGEAQAKSIQAIGIAKAEATKKAGIAEQQSVSDIAQAERATAEQQMEVVKVNQVKQAEIDKEKEIIQAEMIKRKIEIKAEADKFAVETEAAAKLEAQKKDALGVQAVGEAEAKVIAAKGMSEAEAEKARQLASVIAQTELAKEIGENQGYQDYLIRVKTVDKEQIVEVAKAESMAKALQSADLKILANSGDVQSGMNKFSDILSAKGGSQINGLLESLKQTEEGAALLGLLKNLNPMSGLTDSDKK